jgi:hypothetical protein
VDYLDPEVRRLAGALDVAAERVQELLARLALGVDPLPECHRG